MTETSTLVSVVVATNRARPYLTDAIASVAAQTWPDIELIVVDDGSDDPDEVRRAAGQISESRVVQLMPSGVSAARNLGASLARGEYLVFLDDDDLWAPERVERHVTAMIDRRDAVASYCGMRTVHAETGEVLAPADQTAIGDRLDVARRTTGIILPNLFLRRAAFESAGGFDERLRFAEDFDLALRLAQQGPPFVFVPGALVDYRATSANATRRHHELVQGIDAVLRGRRQEASQRGDHALVAALDESIRKNGRFAWWGRTRREDGAAGKAPARGRP
jgi:Predicted glycosyltransferases